LKFSIDETWFMRICNGHFILPGYSFNNTRGTHTACPWSIKPVSKYTDFYVYFML